MGLELLAALLVVAERLEQHVALLLELGPGEGKAGLGQAGPGEVVVSRPESGPLSQNLD